MRLVHRWSCRYEMQCRGRKKLQLSSLFQAFRSWLAPHYLNTWYRIPTKRPVLRTQVKCEIKKNNKHLADQPIDFSWYLILPDHSIKDIKLIRENSANESRTVFFYFHYQGQGILTLWGWSEGLNFGLSVYVCRGQGPRRGRGWWAQKSGGAAALPPPLFALKEK